jgi:hypothetical protein
MARTRGWPTPAGKYARNPQQPADKLQTQLAPRLHVTNKTKNERTQEWTNLRNAPVMEGSAKMRAELTHALSKIADPNRLTKKIEWFNWMDMDIKEHTARKKREKEQSVLDSLPKRMRVPKKHEPTFASMLCTGIVSTLHMLLVLLQVWSIRFQPVDELRKRGRRQRIYGCAGQVD